MKKYSIDIDDINDFNFAELILKNKIFSISNLKYMLLYLYHRVS